MSEWQPIETAPKDGTVIDVWANGERYADVEWDGTFWMMSHGMMSLADCMVGPYDVTHWMPLPPPPAAEEGEG